MKVAVYFVEDRGQRRVKVADVTIARAGTGQQALDEALALTAGPSADWVRSPSVRLMPEVELTVKTKGLRSATAGDVFELQARDGRPVKFVWTGEEWRLADQPEAAGLSVIVWFRQAEDLVQVAEVASRQTEREAARDEVYRLVSRDERWALRPGVVVVPELEMRVKARNGLRLFAAGDVLEVGRDGGRWQRTAEKGWSKT